MKSYFEYLTEEQSEVYTYDDVEKIENLGKPSFLWLGGSNTTAKFVLDEINILDLRSYNKFDNDELDDGYYQATITEFEEVGLDEDEWISRSLFKKIVNGIELSPIVVDENYKILDGNHRMAAYSELWFYHGYDFPFNGKLKILKRISN